MSSVVVHIGTSLEGRHYVAYVQIILAGMNVMTHRYVCLYLVKLVLPSKVSKTDLTKVLTIGECYISFYTEV